MIEHCSSPAPHRRVSPHKGYRRLEHGGYAELLPSRNRATPGKYPVLEKCGHPVPRSRAGHPPMKYPMVKKNDTTTDRPRCASERTAAQRGQRSVRKVFRDAPALSCGRHDAGPGNFGGQEIPDPTDHFSSPHGDRKRDRSLLLFTGIQYSNACRTPNVADALFCSQISCSPQAYPPSRSRAQENGGSGCEMSREKIRRGCFSLRRVVYYPAYDCGQFLQTKRILI